MICIAGASEQEKINVEHNYYNNTQTQRTERKKNITVNPLYMWQSIEIVRTAWASNRLLATRLHFIWHEKKKTKYV